MRLKELCGKWIQPQGKTSQQIGEIIIMEQYLRMLCPELQVWVKEHGPKSAAEAEALLLMCLLLPGKRASREKDARRPTPQYHQRSTPDVCKPPARENQHVALRSHNKIPTCYLCGQEGHTKPMCPKNPAKLTQMCYVPCQNIDVEFRSNQSQKMTTVKINGKPSQPCLILVVRKPWSTGNMYQLTLSALLKPFLSAVCMVMRSLTPLLTFILKSKGRSTC